MESSLLTLKEIAIRLNLPESTLRKYRDMYPQYMPTVGSGRDRLYRPQAIEILKAVRRLRAEALLSWEDTEKQLAMRFPVYAENQDAPEPEPEPEEPLFPPELQEALDKLGAESERQAVMLDAIAGEIIKISQMMKIIRDNLGDLGTLRRTILAQNNDFRALEKSRKNELYAILDRFAQVQGSMSYIQRLFERKAPAPETPATTGESTPETSSPSADESAKLKTVITEREDEIARLKAVNARLLTEVQAMKSRLSEMSPAPPQRAPEAGHDSLPPPPPDRFASSKFVVRAKRK